MRIHRAREVAITPLYQEMRSYFMLQGVTRARNRGPLGWDKKTTKGAVLC